MRDNGVYLRAGLFLVAMCVAAKADDLSAHKTNTQAPVLIDNPTQDGVPFSTCFYARDKTNICDVKYTPQVSAWRICNMVGRVNYSNVLTGNLLTPAPVIQFLIADNGVQAETPQGTGIITQVKCSP